MEMKFLSGMQCIIDAHHQLVSSVEQLKLNRERITPAGCAAIPAIPGLRSLSPGLWPPASRPASHFLWSLVPHSHALGAASPTPLGQHMPLHT